MYVPNFVIVSPNKRLSTVLLLLIFNFSNYEFCQFSFCKVESIKWFFVVARTINDVCSIIQLHRKYKPDHFQCVAPNYLTLVKFSILTIFCDLLTFGDLIRAPF